LKALNPCLTTCLPAESKPVHFTLVASSLALHTYTISINWLDRFLLKPPINNLSVLMLFGSTIVYSNRTNPSGYPTVSKMVCFFSLYFPDSLLLSFSFSLFFEFSLSISFSLSLSLLLSSLLSFSKSLSFISFIFEFYWKLDSFSLFSLFLLLWDLGFSFF